MPLDKEDGVRDDDGRHGAYVDDVALLLNFPEYYNDVEEYSDAELASELDRNEQLIRESEGMFDPMVSYRENYVMRIEAEMRRRAKE